jgi:diadenosine tetraphosphate (Ap4A) HIT family hydrolase
MSSNDPAANATMVKFGYPGSTVAETPHWAVLVRPQQVTLGSLVVACKDPVTALGAVGPAAFADLGQVVARVERALKAAFAYDKINYLMLMMVDPDVHFHVIPRYREAREFAGVTWRDAAWPRPPDLASAHGVPDAALDRVREVLGEAWRAAAG